jgi:hypothetical protein
MRQNRGRSENLLEKLEGLSALFSKSPRDTFPGKPSEGNGYVRVIVNETMVEVGETEEGLNIFDLPRVRPITNRLNFLFGHRKSIGREHIAKELHRISVPFAFIGFGIETVAKDVITLHGRVPCAETGCPNRSRCRRYRQRHKHRAYRQKCHS